MLEKHTENAQCAKQAVNTLTWKKNQLYVFSCFFTSHVIMYAVCVEKLWIIMEILMAATIALSNPKGAVIGKDDIGICAGLDI